METSLEILNVLKKLQEKITASEIEKGIKEEFEKIMEKFNKYYSGEAVITAEEIEKLLPEYEKTLKLLEQEKEKTLIEIEKVKNEKKVINSYLQKNFRIEGSFLDQKR